VPFVIDVDKVVMDNDGYYSNEWGTQCLALVQQAPLLIGTSVPRMVDMRRGAKVKDLAPSQISKGTAIATFDENGRYPKTARHGAIFVSHDANGIVVIDQWVGKGWASQRTLKYLGSGTRRVDDGDWYWIIESEATLFVPGPSNPAGPTVTPVPGMY
jgi:hypothetical protein